MSFVYYRLGVYEVRVNDWSSSSIIFLIFLFRWLLYVLVWEGLVVIF